MKHFIFGVDFSPRWFLELVARMHVEYVTNKGRVVGCRFYNVKTNQEQEIKIGETITLDMLYRLGEGIETL